MVDHRLPILPVALAALLLGAGRLSAQVAVHPAPDFANDRGVLIAKGTTLPAGGTYVSVTMPGAVFLVHGITDRLTIEGGTLPWTIFAADFFGFASVRYGIVRTRSVHVALGGFAAAAGGWGLGSQVAGWPYVTATVGSPRVSLTGLAGVGAGSFGILDGDVIYDGQTLWQANAEITVKTGVQLTAELLSLGGASPIGIAAMRLTGGPYQIGLGAMHNLSGDGALPWVGVSVPLHRGRR